MEDTLRGPDSGRAVFPASVQFQERCDSRLNRVTIAVGDDNGELLRFWIITAVEAQPRSRCSMTGRSNVETAGSSATQGELGSRATGPAISQRPGTRTGPLNDQIQTGRPSIGDLHTFELTGCVNPGFGSLYGAGREQFGGHDIVLKWGSGVTGRGKTGLTGFVVPCP
ncbi:MAG: hypothetical protein WAV78_19385 [Xanthobacteraceae bacterium]